MKFAARKFQNFAVLAAVLCAVLLSGCAKLEDNMAASRKEHLVPGKQIHLDNMRGYQFCEVALITRHDQGQRHRRFLQFDGNRRLHARAVCRPRRKADHQRDRGTDCLPQPVAALDVR